MEKVLHNLYNFLFTPRHEVCIRNSNNIFVIAENVCLFRSLDGSVWLWFLLWWKLWNTTTFCGYCSYVSKLYVIILRGQYACTLLLYRSYPFFCTLCQNNMMKHLETYFSTIQWHQMFRILISSVLSFCWIRVTLALVFSAVLRVQCLSFV